MDELKYFAYEYGDMLSIPISVVAFKALYDADKIPLWLAIVAPLIICSIAFIISVYIRASIKNRKQKR